MKRKKSHRLFNEDVRSQLDMFLFNALLLLLSFLKKKKGRERKVSRRGEENQVKTFVRRRREKKVS